MPKERLVHLPSFASLHCLQALSATLLPESPPKSIVVSKCQRLSHKWYLSQTQQTMSEEQKILWSNAAPHDNFCLSCGATLLHMTSIFAPHDTDTDTDTDDRNVHNLEQVCHVEQICHVDQSQIAPHLQCGVIQHCSTCRICLQITNLLWMLSCRDLHCFDNLFCRNSPT